MKDNNIIFVLILKVAPDQYARRFQEFLEKIIE